jgi:hypothetical protein
VPGRTPARRRSWRRQPRRQATDPPPAPHAATSSCHARRPCNAATGNNEATARQGFPAGFVPHPAARRSSGGPPCSTTMRRCLGGHDRSPAALARRYLGDGGARVACGCESPPTRRLVTRAAWSPRYSRAERAADKVISRYQTEPAPIPTARPSTWPIASNLRRPKSRRPSPCARSASASWPRLRSAMDTRFVLVAGGVCARQCAGRSCCALGALRVATWLADARTCAGEGGGGQRPARLAREVEVAGLSQPRLALCPGRQA